MAVSGDWITPRLNDLKYFEKPPLQYWVTAAAYRAFGVHEWTARLWPALAGFLAVIAIGYRRTRARRRRARRLRRAGARGNAVACGDRADRRRSTPGSRSSWRSRFAAFVIAQRPKRPRAERRAWMWVAWAAMAGATLSKGLIGIVLPAGALVAYTLVTRDVARLAAAAPRLGPGALSRADRAVVRRGRARATTSSSQFFFIHEHFERFLTTEHRRTGPVVVLRPARVVGILPWLSCSLYGARRAWRDGGPNALGFSWQRFALVWAAFVFVFFSASGSKLPSYILPMFAPLALVTGWLAARGSSADAARLALPGAMVAAVTRRSCCSSAYDRFAARFAERRATGRTCSWPTAVAQGRAARRDGRRGRVRSSPFVGLATARRRGSGASLALSAVGARRAAARRRRLRRVQRDALDSAILRAAQASRRRSPPTPRSTRSRCTIRPCRSTSGARRRSSTIRDELALGIDAEPDKAIPTIATWIAEWQRSPQGYAMMPPDALRARSRPTASRCACSRAIRAACSSRGSERHDSMSLRRAFAFLMTGVLLNAGAQLLLKAGTNVLGVITLTRENWPDTLVQMATQGYFVLGVACYVRQLFVWILGLSRVPVSVAYPLLSVGYIINAIAAHYLFGEAVTRRAGSASASSSSASGWSRGAKRPLADERCSLSQVRRPRARRGDDRRRRRRAALRPDHERPVGAAVRGGAVGVLRRPAGARADLGDRRDRGRAAALRHRSRATR